MMYQNRFVVTVKHNGKVLREVKQQNSELTDTVMIPFGAEYSLLFKNLNSVRALVRVHIDGQDATKNTSLIVGPNESVELERFLDAANLQRGHKFKFIERTQKIEDGPRGIKPDDGLIRVEFEFEQPPPKVDYDIKRTYIDEVRWKNSQYPYNTYPYTTFSATSADVKYAANASSTDASGTLRSAGRRITSNSTEFLNIASNASSNSVSANDVGITVPGSESNQKFEVGSYFKTDGQKHVMVMKIVGKVGEKEVVAPVTVKTKIECPTCGTKNSYNTKFCGECGTNLSA